MNINFVSVQVLKIVFELNIRLGLIALTYWFLFLEPIKKSRLGNLWEPIELFISNIRLKFNLRSVVFNSLVILHDQLGFMPHFLHSNEVIIANVAIVVAVIE